MNTRIAVTMRVTEASAYPERRDAVDRNWGSFLSAALPGVAWMAMPNIGPAAVDTARAFGINGLILTGGDDWGVHPCRDSTEQALLAWATERDVPVLGVCRGAQGINLHFGGCLKPSGQAPHRAVRHVITWCDASIGHKQNEVNSYHGYVIPLGALAPPLAPLALAQADGTVEAFVLPSHPVLGLLWHPEREAVPAQHDLQLLRQLFDKECA